MLKGFAFWEDSTKQSKLSFRFHIPKLELTDPKFQSYFLNSHIIFLLQSHMGKITEEKVVEIGVIEQKRCDLSQLI